MRRHAVPDGQGLEDAGVGQGRQMVAVVGPAKPLGVLVRQQHPALLGGGGGEREILQRNGQAQVVGL
jgi:hypothetical protein